MAPSFLQFDPRRIRSYVFRLPLCTRILTLVIVAFWIASLTLPWFRSWASLSPGDFNFHSMYRLNTFPLLHGGFLHFLFNIIALVPLLERFESENGSLPTLILFTGPFGTLPGGIYIVIERFILHMNTTVFGASIWVFLLLCSESIKTYRQNPNFAIGPYNIPTWTTPLIAAFFIAVLVPNTSFIGHLCGCAIGYLWGLGYIKFLVPSEKILRWIEGKLNLLGRLPHYVSVDQKTYGRYGVLPTTAAPRAPPTLATLGTTQRLGP